MKIFLIKALRVVYCLNSQLTYLKLLCMKSKIFKVKEIQKLTLNMGPSKVDFLLTLGQVHVSFQAKYLTH